MISSFSPLSNRRSMKYNNGEIWIQKKNLISSNWYHIKKSRFWARLERIGDQWRLNHNNWIRNIFSVQNHSEVCCLIRAVVEDLYKKNKWRFKLRETTVYKVLVLKPKKYISLFFFTLQVIFVVSNCIYLQAGSHFATSLQGGKWIS